MSDPLNDFVEKKKANSWFVGLGDGESIKFVKVHETKKVEKQAFGGEETEVIRIVAEVETPLGIKMKQFDNGTLRFVQQLVDAGIVKGSAFTRTRKGLKTNTRYEISDVQNPA